VIAAAVTSWGFGDAAAALVGKRFGRTPVRSHLIESAKTWEGASAMLVVSGLALIVTLHFYGGCPLDGCIQAAFVLAPILAAVELLSRRGSDTVTLPLTAAFLLLPLLRWMGALAVAG
jgi:dolichol kinase